jgi:hypothetical protein
MNKPAPGSDQFYLIIFPAVPAGGWNLETIILLALGHATLPGACKGGGIRVGATGGLGARSKSDWAWCTLAVPLLALVVGGLWCYEGLVCLSQAESYHYQSETSRPTRPSWATFDGIWCKGMMYLHKVNQLVEFPCENKRKKA